MQMLGLQSELELGAGLAEERAYFTQARETFTIQEQRYIDRVEQAHQRLESLRAIKGVGSKHDELDLPREVEVLISQKYKEREQLKSEVLLRDVSTALHPHIQQRYERFYEYFEQLYQGILLQLMSFKLSNDMDDFGYYQGALHQGQQVFFGER